jgi:oxygen-dependent protoporphyrinogen oxidase
VSVDVVVVGGGITGLAAAYDLQKRGVRVAVLEASGRTGGLIHTTHIDGFTIEDGAESLLAQKPAAIELCRELGFEGTLRNTRPPGGAFVLRGTTLHRLPVPSMLGLPIGWKALLRYSLLPPMARARLALEPLVPTRRADDDESVASFFRRRFGASTVDLIAQPLLGGIHAGDIEQLSMLALFPRLVTAERTRGHVLTLSRNAATSPATPARTTFVALEGGMSDLIAALESALSGAVRVNARVERLERDGDGWRVSFAGTAGTDTVRARAAILAVPAYVAGELLSPVDAEAARLCAEVVYVSTASVAMAWPRANVPHPLSGTGFVVARRHSDVRITACTWVSSKWEHRAPAGMALLRAFIGGAHDPAAVDLDDARLIEVARRDLERTLGITAEPALARVCRWRRAAAQHTVGQLARVDAIERALARHRGLFVAGSGFRSVGILDCVADARRVASAAFSAGLQ